MAGKKNKKRVGKMPHANGVDEVMQKAREKAEASKPPLTEEEKLTIEEARKVLTEKAEILREALEERDRVKAEASRIQEELGKLEAACAAKGKTLRLDEEAQAVLDQRDALLEEAEKQKADLLAAAEKEAQIMTASARNQAEQTCLEAKEEAGRIANEIQAKAEAEAKALLEAAREEERKVIEEKERTAQLRADAILARADDFEKRSRASAGEYEAQVRENAHQKAAEIIAAGNALLKKREEALDQRQEDLNEREIELNQREAAFPELAERLAAERTAALRKALEECGTRQAEREAAMNDREDELNFIAAELREEKRLFQERVKTAVAEQHSVLKNEVEQMREAANAMRKDNQEIRKKLNEATIIINRMQGQDGQALYEESQRLQTECGRLKDTLKEFELCGITPERISEITGHRERIQDLQNQVESLTKELETARHQAVASVGALEQLNDAEGRMASLRNTNKELLEELDKRKQVSREEMVRPIEEVPAFLNVPLPDEDPEELADEDQWLEHIRLQSEKSGIIFSPRQLMAYHTCLKINEWSPMVVLSGVSGTGKSELPRQYAVHGGMQFLSLPVKPDWDSPASLFGYYNAIENKFEATELVRTLYQMQRSQKNRWSRGMLMVLLDEMNLAHPEQYFADLLSKFEEARNSDRDPCYEIVLGAGESPMQLDIGRNVMWTGTMNEDETTKGLSDKVIDRSMLITFPCPKELYDRDNSKMEKPQLTLSCGRWEQWKARAVHKDSDAVKDAMVKCKGLIQQVNWSLSAMGRNLGHRVWQSIQNYILHYPLVILAAQGRGDLEPAIQQAFCDALAFKMMPKLRGLEVRGQNEEHIEEIRQCLASGAPELMKDFEHACKLTSEVFQWSSAEFMGL